MGILEILYPARCPVCHGIVKGRDGICPDCRKKLHYIKEPKCKKCGKQIEKMEIVSVAPIFAEAIKRVYTNGPISELF